MFSFLFIVFLSNPLPQVLVAPLLPKCISNFALFLFEYLEIYFDRGSLGNKNVPEVNGDGAHLIAGTLGRMEPTGSHVVCLAELSPFE